MRPIRPQFLFPLVVLLVVCVALTMFGQQPGSTATGKIVRLDPALDKIVPPGAKIEKLAGNLRFTEGPIWIKSGGYLLFSDLMANAIMKWSPEGNASIYRRNVFPGSFPDAVLIGSNGLTLDRQGRILAAEHGNRRIARLENDTWTTVADRFEGKRLNSPNDLVVKRNGDIYFGDPPALYRNSMGVYPDVPNKPQQELDFNGLYRVTAAGKLELLTKDVPYPNGIAFSPDESKLYVASSRPDKLWMQFDVTKDGTITNGRKVADVTKEPGEGVPDGMKVDTAGNIYATALTGVQIFSPQWKRLGTIETPEIASNCAWGDADGKTLYITARTGVYRIKLSIPGIRP